MRISLNWLADFVELAAAEELARRLTFAGLEVERTERLGQQLERVVVGQIVSTLPHPHADRLALTEVEVGTRRLQIVCGAKNFKVGDRVPVALPGALLPGGVSIAETELRGIRSEGMLCSQAELGLGAGRERSPAGAAIPSTAEGLWILTTTLNGEPLADALFLRDTVFEVNVTPNRGDCLSHLGIAREVVALTRASWRVPAGAAPPLPRADASDPELPELSGQDRCSQLMGQMALSPQAGWATAASPLWMQARLSACGVRPLGLAVDVTNYVMLELGQPLHAYDRDQLRHGLRVRLAAAGERLTTLDGVARALSPDDLLICDADRPVGLAGVMGGLETSVGPATQRLYLEAATFLPAGIRRTAKRHGLTSEAAHRFERGVDPHLPARALARAMALLGAEANGAVQAAHIHQQSEARKVRLSFARTRALLGVNLSDKQIVDRLAAVEVVPASQADTSLFAIPSHRPDLVEAVDLVAEAGRQSGFDLIEARSPQHTPSPPTDSPEQTLAQSLRRSLSAAGFAETVNYSFLDHPLSQRFRPVDVAASVRLQNPLKHDQGQLRQSLLPSLCLVLRQNLAFLTRDAGVPPAIRLYELARVYRWPGPQERALGPVLERTTLGLLCHGPRLPLGWGNSRESADVFDLIGWLENLFGSAHRTLQMRATAEVPFLHPRSAAELWSGADRVGLAGNYTRRLRQNSICRDRRCWRRLTHTHCWPHPSATSDVPFLVSRRCYATWR